MRALTDLIHVHGVDVDPHLDREALVPVSTGMQRQGDVIVIPTPHAGLAATTPIPPAGVAVVRGEMGGNTHLLLADGDAQWDEVVDRRGLDIGVLFVPGGSTAYLAHPEHGYAGIGPGSYVVRRQREQADEIRMVAD